jgi:transcriptional regulator
MYIPKINEETDQNLIFDFIKKNAFGIIISSENNVPMGTHIPIELSFNEARQPILKGHVARANPHWQIWEKQNDVLAIFSGAHSYISSSWYEKSAVSTWNYIAVHIYGKIRIVNDDELIQSLRGLTNKYEQNQANPLHFETFEADYIQKMIRGIVGFEISIDTIEAKSKLSQNRNDKDYQNIIQNLNHSDDPFSKEIAKEMALRRTE